MVSKSKILGKPPLILVSIGSTKFPFSRLSSVLKEIDKNRYQIIDKFLPPDQFIASIKKADKIIVHGGPGTIFLAFKYAKFMPLIIPRLAKYREHVDDHQLFFTKYLRSKLPDSLKKYFVTNEKIKDVIGRYLKIKNVPNNLSKYLFINKKENKLIKNLDKYLSSI
jgi:hypothetical protein